MNEPTVLGYKSKVGCNQTLYSTFLYVIFGQTLNHGSFAAAAQCTATPRATAGC